MTIRTIQSFTMVIVYHEGLPTKSQEYTTRSTSDEMIKTCRAMIENNKAIHTLALFQEDWPKPILEYHRAFGELQDGY